MVGNRSLQFKLLAPLLGVRLVLSIIAVITAHRRDEAESHHRLQTRAEIIAHAVNHAAESLSEKDELGRFVSALGAEPDVKLILVALGDPPRILSSTRLALRGVRLDALPMQQWTQALNTTLSSKRSKCEVIQQTQEVQCVLALSVSNRSAFRDTGAILVSVDTRPAQRSLAHDVRTDSLHMMSVIAIVVLLASALLRYFVIRPLCTMGAAALRRSTGDLKALAPLYSIDELGQLAEKLNRANRGMDDALRRLGHQKFAIDQAMIVSSTDIHGTITEINGNFCSLSGFSPEALIGSNHRVLESGVHAKAFFQNMLSVIEKGNVWRGEICNRANEGHLYRIDATIVPVLNEEGKVEAYTTICTDITARKAAEGELRRHRDHLNELVNEQTAFLSDAKDKAEHANRAKSEFLANMSHESRTPMHAILSFAQLGIERAQKASPEKLVGYFSHVLTSAQRLLRLLNDLLDLAKLEAGKMRLECEWHDLAVLAAEAVTELGVLARAKNIELMLTTDGAPVPVWCDALRTLQVLRNLLSNAIKFSLDGSRARIQASAGYAPHDGVAQAIRIGCVEVVDHGVGIPDGGATFRMALLARSNKDDTSRITVSEASHETVEV